MLTFPSGNGTNVLNRTTAGVGLPWLCMALERCSLRTPCSKVSLACLWFYVPPDIVFPLALDWQSLPDGATVVDVGGGIGTSSLQISRAFPKVKTIVQDFPEVVAQAKAVSTKFSLLGDEP